MNSSNDLVNSVLSDVKSFDSEYQIQNKFDFSGKSIERWKKWVSYAIEIFSKTNAKYTIIKAHDILFADIGDADFLIEDKKKLIEIYNILDKAGFKFKHIPFNHRMKVSAIKLDLDIDIDFYPDSKWGELRYARSGTITEHRRKGNKNGLDVWIPKPEHEIYIIASHSYYHGRINLLEILSTAKIILQDNPSFDEIIKISEKFHLQNGVLILLSAVNSLLKNYGYNVPYDNELKKLKSLTSNRYRKIAEKEFSLDNIPIRFSISDLLSSSLKKITTPTLDSSSSRFDELFSFIKHNRFSNLIYNRTFPKYVDAKS